MIVLYKLLPALLALLLACGPKQEEVQIEPPKALQAEEVMQKGDEPDEPGGLDDSLVNVPKDGTVVDRSDEDQKLVLPQEVISLLSQRYPGWQEPELMEDVQEHAEHKEQGPLLVQSDFDGDNLQDLAMQLQYKGQVIVLAFTQPDSTWQLHELKRDILFNERGALKSLYYLYLAEEGTIVRSRENYRPTELKTEAIGLGLNDQTTVFLYQNDSTGFIALESRD